MLWGGRPVLMALLERVRGRALEGRSNRRSSSKGNIIMMHASGSGGWKLANPPASRNHALHELAHRRPPCACGCGVGVVAVVWSSKREDTSEEASAARLVWLLVTWLSEYGGMEAVLSAAHKHVCTVRNPPHDKK